MNFSRISYWGRLTRIGLTSSNLGGVGGRGTWVISYGAQSVNRLNDLFELKDQSVLSVYRGAMVISCCAIIGNRLNDLID